MDGLAEQVIIEIAVAFGNNKLWDFHDKRDLSKIAAMLDINPKILTDALYGEHFVAFDQDHLRQICHFGNHDYSLNEYEYLFFAWISEYYFILKDLKNIKKDFKVSKEEREHIIAENKNCFDDAAAYLEFINCFSSSYEFSKTQIYSYENTMYTTSVFSPVEDIRNYFALSRMPFLFESKDEYLSSLALEQELISYGILTHARALYFAVVCQMLSEVNCIPKRLRTLSREFFLTTVDILQNARLISIETN